MPLPSVPSITVTPPAVVDDPRPEDLATPDVGSASPENALSAEETRELARLAVAIAVIVFLFGLSSIAIVLDTGDAATATGGVIQFLAAAVLFYARRQLIAGRSQRGVVLVIVSTLVACVVMATIPPPVPALAAAPIMAVAFALSFLHGRRLRVALVAAWVVSIVTAVIVEFTPASPDLPAEYAAASRIVSFAAIVGFIALVLYRHRRRLEQAVDDAKTATDALRDSEARYRTVVEGVRDVIFRIDRDGDWALLNHAWEEITGHTVAETIGRPVIDSIHPDDREHHAGLAGLVVEGELDVYRHELRIIGAARLRHLGGGARPTPARRDRRVHGHVRDPHRRDRASRARGASRAAGLPRRADRAGEPCVVQGPGRARADPATRRPRPRRRCCSWTWTGSRRSTTASVTRWGTDCSLRSPERLHSVLRPEDTIARLGGDEFAILVDDIATPQDVLALAERISAAFDAAVPAR